MLYFYKKSSKSVSIATDVSKSCFKPNLVKLLLEQIKIWRKSVHSVSLMSIHNAKTLNVIRQSFAMAILTKTCLKPYKENLVKICIVVWSLNLQLRWIAIKIRESVAIATYVSKTFLKSNQVKVLLEQFKIW